jgi:hypothetical protein
MRPRTGWIVHLVRFERHVIGEVVAVSIYVILLNTAHYGRQTTQPDETRRPHDSLATFVFGSMGLLSHLPPRVLPLAVEDAVHALHVVDRVRAWTAEDEVTFLEVRVVQGSLDSHDEVVTRTAVEDVVLLFAG